MIGPLFVNSTNGGILTTFQAWSEPMETLVLLVAVIGIGIQIGLHIAVVRGQNKRLEIVEERAERDREQVNAAHDKINGKLDKFVDDTDQRMERLMAISADLAKGNAVNTADILNLRRELDTAIRKVTQ